MGQLERIANALERIAAAAEALAKVEVKRGACTPFPYDQVSPTLYSKIEREFGHALSCEELIRYGRGRLRELRGIGETTIQRIDTIMDVLGFDDQWGGGRVRIPKAKYGAPDFPKMQLDRRK